jgi:hypothetical protein
MLSGISNPFGTNPFGTEMQVASVAFYTAAGLLAGRKFCLAAGCKLGGTVAGLMKRQNAAEWNQASADYLTQAKKDTVRDVAAVAGFVGALALVAYANEALVEREKKSQYLSNEKIGAGIFLTGMAVPSILGKLGWGFLKKCVSFNECISESTLCMPVNQLIVRPSMYLLIKCLGGERDYYFQGRGLSSLWGSSGEARMDKMEFSVHQ